MKENYEMLNFKQKWLRTTAFLVALLFSMSAFASQNLLTNDGPYCVGDDMVITFVPCVGVTNVDFSGPGGFISSLSAPNAGANYEFYVTDLTLADAGSYSVSVTGGTCAGTHNTTVTVNPLPAKPTITGDEIFCGQYNNTPLIIPAVSNVTYTWVASSPATITPGASLNQVIVNWETTPFGANVGWANVKLTDNTTGCEVTSDNHVVSIYANPVVYTINYSALNYCPGEGGVTIGLSGQEDGTVYELQKNFNTVATVTGSAGGGAFNFAGLHPYGSYRVLATDNTNNCEKKMTNSQTVVEDAAPSAPSVSGSPICFDGSAHSLTATGSIITWYSDAALTTVVGSGNTSPAHTIVGDYDYWVTDQTSAGCEGLATATTLTINALPTVTCPTDMSVCANDAQFALTGGDPTSPGSGVYSGTGVSGGNFNPATAGVGTHTITYTYTDTQSPACEDYCTFTITVYAEPQAEMIINGVSTTYNYSESYCYDDVMSFNLGSAMVSGDYPLDIEWTVTFNGNPSALSGAEAAAGADFDFGFADATLPAGTYVFSFDKFIDANGCSPSNLGAYTATIVINPEPAVIFANNGSQFYTGAQLEYCYNNTVTVTLDEIVEGTGPFDLTWTVDDGTGPVADNASGVNVGNQLFSNTLPVGTHTVQITGIVDANGCSPSSYVPYTATFIVYPEPEAEIHVNGSAVTFNYEESFCSTQIMSFDLASMVSGAGPLQSVAWSTEYNGSPAPTLSGSATSVSLPFDFNFTDATLDPGIYVFTITELTDANGCSPSSYAPYNASITISTDPLTDFSFDGTVLGTNGNKDYCFGDAVNVTLGNIYGGQEPFDYEYSVEGTNSSANDIIGATVTNVSSTNTGIYSSTTTLPPDVYTVTITELKDANGCYASQDNLDLMVATVTVHEVIADVTGDSPVTEGTVGTYNAQTGSGYSYNWIVTGGSISSGQGSSSIEVEWPFGVDPDPYTENVKVEVTSSYCPDGEEDDMDVTIEPQNVEGYVKYYNQYNTLMNDVTLKLFTSPGGVQVGTEVLSAFDIASVKQGYYKFSNVPDGDYYISASYDTWGGVNATDALAIQLGVVNADLTLAPYNYLWWNNYTKLACDVNQSGFPGIDLTGLDALMVKYRSVGYIADFSPAPDHYFAYSGGNVFPAMPSDIVGPAPAAPFTISDASRVDDIYVLCAGDANASYVPNNFKSESKCGLVYDGVNYVKEGTVFEIPVRISENTELGAVTLGLNFDPSVISIENVLSSSCEGLVYNVVDNKLMIAWSDLAGVDFDADAEILTILAKANKSLDSQSKLFTLNGITELADASATVLENVDFKIANFTSSQEDLGFAISNSPNPAKDNTVFNYSLPETGNVTIVLNNYLGQTVSTLVENTQQAGTYSLNLDCSDLAPGVYMYKFVVKGETTSYTETRSMVISR